MPKIDKMGLVSIVPKFFYNAQIVKKRVYLYRLLC